MFNVIDSYFMLYEEYLTSVAKFEGASPDHRDIARHATEGALKLADAIYLYEHVQAARPQRIVEIGSFLGFSTRWLLQASQGWAASILSVDPGLRHRIFDQPRDHLRQFCAGFGARLSLRDACLSEKNEGMFMHDCLMYEPHITPREALARMDRVPVLTEPFGDFDFAFVDGDHGFSATVDNVLLVSRMMPNGGTIIVHDAISWRDVGPALKKLCADTASLSLTGIDGVQFHFGVDKISRALGKDAEAIKSSLSDGLGVVKVVADVRSEVRREAEQVSEAAGALPPQPALYGDSEARPWSETS